MTDWTAEARTLFVARGVGAPIPCHVAAPAGTVRGLVLLLHGRNGAAGQPQIEAIARAYLARGWQVAAPDLPHSEASPGSGASSEFTITGHAAAAAEVLGWLRGAGPAASLALAGGHAAAAEDVLGSLRRAGPVAPFALAGHSLGAYAAAVIAAQAGALHHLLAVSPALSGRALLAARRAMGPDAVAALEREAPLMRAEMEGCDAAPALARLTAPVAVLTGGPDGITPPRFARAFFASAPEGRFYATIPDQHHCPTGPGTARLLDAALDAVEA